jgi:DNA (cytosine-5)-methyltransferase 1
MTAFSRLSRFGMTFKPLTADRGEELLTLYLAAFHAKTSAPQERAQELTESDPGCGATWRGWLAKYDPATSLWRTAQCSLLEDLNESLAILPRWGMTQNGLLWEQPMLEPITRGTGYGLSPNGVDKFHTPNTTGLDGGSNSRKALKKKMESWPTPRTRGLCGGSGSWDLLKKNLPNMEEVRGMGGGKLNPMWTEWLMGWPLGWTDLKPLETDKFRLWQQQHGVSSSEEA